MKKAAIAGVTLAGADFLMQGADSSEINSEPEPQIPWYKRITRWGQTNITEKDPVIYDIGWWRNHWKNTHTQGVIINAGGIVAYYPTKYLFITKPNTSRVVTCLEIFVVQHMKMA